MVNDLTHRIYGEIQKVIGEKENIRMSEGEQRFGVPQFLKKSGESYQTQIILLRDGSNVDKYTINFTGWPPLEKGDKVCAHLFLATEGRRKEWVMGLQEVITWDSRDLQLEEDAYQLDKYREGEVVAVYQNLSHPYFKFSKGR